MANNGTPEADPPFSNYQTNVLNEFRKQVHERPDSIALVYGPESLSYAELDARSRAFGAVLQQHGIGQQDLVTILLDRSIELYVAMLASARIGAVFVPLDKSQSAPYSRTLLHDYGIRFLVAREIASSELGDLLPELQVIAPTESPSGEPTETSIDACDPLYVMFTSGTSGKPKGVVVPHRGVVRLVKNQHYVRFAADEVFCQLAPAYFDASTLEIWGSLLNGAKLVIPPAGPLSFDEIARLIRDHGVTTLWLTAALFHSAVDRAPELFAPLRQLIFGGDVISPARVERLSRAYPDLRMMNGYGPTENTTFTTVYEVPREFAAGTASLPIGTPINGTRVYVLDEKLQPVPRGTCGQLCAAGDGLALGYLGQPDLTGQKFVIAANGERVYLTGDLVRELADGNLEFCGRLDSQVKINGQRVELDAVEQALKALPGVREAAVLCNSAPGDEKQIVGFVEPQTQALCERDLREALRATLPHFAMPSRIIFLGHIPIGATGKIDRQALRGLLDCERPLPHDTSEPNLERRITALWRRLLHRDDIDRDRPFFEHGGTSLQLVEMHHALESWNLGPIALTELFQHATVASLAARLGRKQVSSSVEPVRTDRSSGAIAVIGMAGRFPGARNPEEMWNNFVNGVEAIRTFREEELEDVVDDETRKSARYVKARAILDDVESFDAELFGFYPREAELTDPQQRVLLECAWEALENAGYVPKQYPGRIGLFAGASLNTYLLFHLCKDRRFIEDFSQSYQVGSFPTLVGNGADFTASRISYKLDLRGPAVTVQSACSTSLLAVAQACEGLRSGKMDMALAGGVSISLPQRRGYVYQQGGIVSPDGHCRPFDADANGTVFGSGAGIVLLKRLDDAIRDGDRICAVIRGIGLSNDGGTKAGYAAPSVEGQAAAIEMAHRDAGVTADTIQYVECHGTGTPLGDPIEIAALAKAFSASARQPYNCAISSAKSSVGHLDVAAGITGLIRACMALQHQQVPATLHFRQANPRLELEKTSFYVASANSPWPRNGHPRRAGVSAFGVGGTNVHIVLEEAPARAAAPTCSIRKHHLFVLSGKSAEAVNAAHDQLRDHLAQSSDTDLADAEFTLALGRQHFTHRTAVVVEEGHVAEAFRSRPAMSTARENPQVVFLFPGQGSQYPGMAADFHRSEAVFRAAFEDCFEAGRACLPAGLRNLLLDPNSNADELRSTRYAQPALFIVEHALARLWIHWGVEPVAMVGHSVGEVAAACLAGTFTLSDALKFLASRGEMMQRMAPGAMLSVRMSAADLQPRLERLQLSLAAVNAPMLSVAAGPVDGIAELEAELLHAKVMFRRLHTSHAFHSASLDPILPELEALARSLQLRAPARTVISSCTGQELAAEDAMSPAYWARHGRSPVQFSAALAQVATLNPSVLLEVGPGQTLETLARQQCKLPALEFAGSLPGADTGATAELAIVETVGKLWSLGFNVNWENFLEGGTRARIPLPTYPFQRKRCWIDAPKSASTPSQQFEANANIPKAEGKTTTMADTTQVLGERKSFIASEIRQALRDLSGIAIDAAQEEASFVELGFDSLFLTQVSQEIQKRYRVKVTFRQLLTEYSSTAKLAEFLAAQLPAEPQTAPTPKPIPQEIEPTRVKGPAGLESLFREQLQTMSELMQRQLEAWRGATAPAATAAEVPHETHPVPAASALFPVSHTVAELTTAQREHIAQLVARYTAKTAGSKKLTEQYRAVLADPRVVAGFCPEWKEMVYSVVTERSQGSKLWDVDGNEYIDLVNGFGPTMFGHAPAFVTEAIAAQMQRGFEVGPQSPLAGKVAQLVSELTGCERVTFCNTGSEAVMAAIRIARTVTGRDRIALFAGDYHGQFDEVLVKQGALNGTARTVAVAPGIPAANLSNIVVLEYGSNESLNYIRENSSELAAVLVEPVQSRHPNLQPRAFLQDLRAIAASSGTALIFDEVVTGFRTHPGGAQAVFGVRADLVTYGKVVGGGMPIGILAGAARFMDALDGGRWQYGDASAPETGMTFFAGTFVRHPLALAAVYAVLSRMKQEGPVLQETLNRTTGSLVARLNRLFTEYELKSDVENFGSIFYFNLRSESRFSSLLYYHLREKGIHILEGFPCYLTTEHSQADLDRVVEAFDRSLAELADAGLLGRPKLPTATDNRLFSAPLTEAQVEVLLAAQLSDAASCSFNESFTLELEGDLDVSKLRSAIRALFDRHDALRATINAATGRMHFQTALQADLPLIDLSQLDPAAQTEAIRQIKEREASTAFNLQSGPLVRLQLLRLGHDSYRLVWTAHHIVCDGWSTNVLLQELGEIYKSKLQGIALQPRPALSFARFAEGQSKSSPETVKAQTYWQQQFEQIPPLLDLPTDSPRPVQRSYRGGTCYGSLPSELNRALKSFSAAQRCTKFVTLLGCFQLLLARLSQQEEVVVLVPSAAQSQIEDAVLVGHGVNLLPIRTRAQKGETVGDFLSRVNGTVLNAYEHSNHTFGSLIQHLPLKRERGRLPLAEVQFNLERVGDAMNFPGLRSSVRSNGKRFTNFDLFLNVVDTGAELRLECDYNADIFAEDTVTRWLKHYQTLLENMIAGGSSHTLGELSLLSADERHSLTYHLNRTRSEYPSNVSLPELISAQASRTPQAIAACDEAGELSYAELDRRAACIAALLQRMGVRPNDMVGVLVERTVMLPAVLLGILKAGAAYVPLDPVYPRTRIEFILNETQVPVLITSTRAAQQLSIPRGTQVICLDRSGEELAEIAPAQAVAVDSGALAYVIYTSGSTGQPKGVEITHRSLVNLLASARALLEMESSDRLLAVTTVSFDIAGLELFLPLICDARVVIASKQDVADGQRLAERIKENGITAMQATPSTWKLLLEAGFRPPVGFKALCGGEAWSRQLADELLALGCRVWNMYGPTETTIWSSIVPVESGKRPPAIRASVANTSFYVLDDNLQLLPVGVPGQLYISGDGVARGYYRRPELTASRFLVDPFADGLRKMYATGDQVRLLPDGTIEFLGRTDFQVKIRGYRIELGEVESCFTRVSGISEVVAVARSFDPDDTRLVLYYVAENPLPSLSEIRERMRQHVPDYMVPALFMRVDRLPLTDNGKIDRKALPAPELLETQTRLARQPVTENQTALVRICAEVLGLPIVGIDEDLLELGADSIHLFQITARANKQGLPIAASLLWSHRTIEKICAEIDAMHADAALPASHIRPLKREQYRVWLSEGGAA